MTEPPTSGEVHYQTADFVALAREVRQRRMRVFRQAALIFAGLMVLTLALDRALDQPMPWVEVGLGFIAAALLFLLASPQVQGRLIALGARRQRLLVPHVFAVTAPGLEARSQRGESRINWSAVQQVHVAQGRMFAFVSDSTAFVVPRRAFTSDEQFEQFVEAAKERWKVHHRL